MNEIFYNSFVDELDKLGAFMGAGRASLWKRMGASPQAVARAGGKPGLARRFWHSGPVKYVRQPRFGWKTTKKQLGTVGGMVGPMAGMVAAEKVLGGGGQQEQAY